MFTQIYTGASRQDANGDWKLWDFGKARNVFVDEIERRGADWVLWMDADDELRDAGQPAPRVVLGPARRSTACRSRARASAGCTTALWRANRGIRFVGRCHEYPTIGGHPTLALVDSVIRHDATPGIGEGANAAQPAHPHRGVRRAIRRRASRSTSAARTRTPVAGARRCDRSSTSARRRGCCDQRP